MTPKEIPVSYEFFKKYTFHEEWVDAMLKTKANGNQEKYETLLQSKEAKENALRSYYEAFYLKPKIRETHHIRLKPVPKKIKDKLLVIPVQDTGAANSKGMSELLEKVCGSNTNVEEPKRRRLMNLKDVCEADDGPVVEDDNEPFGSPEVSCSVSKQVIADNNSPFQTPAKEVQVTSSTKDLHSPETNKTSKQAIGKIIAPIARQITKKQTEVSAKPQLMEADNNNKPETNNEMDTNNNNNRETNNTGTTKSPNPDSPVNYHDLMPYIHCCPISLKEFRKYSNIKQLANEFCKKKKMDVKKQHVIEERSYILFYLAPEQRKRKIIRKIQLLDNCPEDIKSKFFSIPTNLYKKQDLNKTQENIIAESTNTECNVNVETRTTTDPAAGNNVIEMNNIQPIESTVINNIEQNNNQTTQTEFPMDINENQPAIVPEVNNINQQEVTPPCPDQQTQPIINIPVSLDQFKKFTHYEEITEKLFKIKAQDNKELYDKYINSKEAFDSTVCNYYRAFYLTPIIREIFPIRFKPLPNFIKSQLLQIPEGVNATRLVNSFRLEDLVSVEFNVPEVEVENKAINGEDVAQAINNSNISLTSPTNTTSTSIKTTNDTESPHSDSNTKSPTGCTKRATTEDMKSPLPKRQKTQQTQDNFEKREKTKKSYKELLPYAHCCPVTLSEFCKYTNVSELFTGYCQKRYNSLKKLPYMLQRAYVLYYLAPENRALKPFSKLKALDECPLNLREKIYTIPQNLHLKGEKGVEEQSENFTQNQAAAANAKKNNIEILENRLLPPAQLSFSTQSSNAASNCINNNCTFYHITYVDFMEQTNILQILSEPQNISLIQNIFKKFIYELVKQQYCDEQFNINGALLHKLFKYNQICEKCESEVEALLKQDSTTTCSEPAKESNFSSSANNEAVSERTDGNNERMETNLETAAIEIKSREVQAVNKSLKSNLTESSSQDAKSQQLNAEKPGKSHEIWKNLKSDKIFQLFCKKLLAKLQQTFDNAIDFSTETYEIFLQCNEIPLNALLNDFCSNNEDIVERILNEKELCEALKCYYYYKYLTNTNFATKYPVKIKQKSLEESEKVRNENQMETEKDKSDKNTILESNENKLHNSNAAKVISPKSGEKPKDNVNNEATKMQDKATSCNNAVEKAKRIFFRHVEKTNTLFYILRTSFGLKQLILRTILTLTFQEFHQLTSIYEGKQLYNDNHLAECMYRYVFRTPVVWPTNLFITLKDLCDFLHKKNIRFNDYSTMLQHISPKLLHWSVLLSCTNILDCVKTDYEKRIGKLLDAYDIKALKEACIEYYNRCWKHEKWLGEVPLVNEEFYKDYLNNDEGNVTMLDQAALVEICQEPDEVSDDIVIIQDNAEPDTVASNLNKSVTKEKVSDSVPQIDAESPTVMDTSPNRSIKEFNCVMLPNTQHQIEMLPPETRVSNDPLNDSNNANISNVSENNCEDDEVECLGELVTNVIKTEACDSKLLNNLLFYEDDNSNMQCMPRSEEIIDLDDSKVQVVEIENLPPSQIEFEDTPVEVILSDELATSGNSNSVMNLAQRLPSSLESNDDIAGTQQQQLEQAHQSSPPFQMVNVSLRSSGENGSHENVQETQLVELDFVYKDNEDECKLNSNELELLQTSVESFVVYVDAQHFPSTFEETPTYSGAAALQNDLITKPTTENLNFLPSENVNTSPASNEVEPSNPSDTLQSATQSNVIFRSLGNKNASVNNSKNVATVRPLKKSHFIPQIQHNTRPLLTKPAYSKANKEISSETIIANSPTVSEQLPSTSLTPIQENSTTNEQSMQNSCLQFQLLTAGTHIHISQEFQKNCSVFNNTSLLRLADHNYLQQSQSSLSSSSLPSTQTQSEEVGGNTNNDGNQQKLQNEEGAVNQQQQPARRVSRRISMLGSQPTIPLRPSSTQTHSECLAGNAHDNGNQQKLQNDETSGTTFTQSTTEEAAVNPARRVTRRSSMLGSQPTIIPISSTNITATPGSPNDKVNNLPLTAPTKNPIATIAPSVHPPQYPNIRMLQKLAIYRQVNRFHYFKELTPQNISKYLLPSLEYGKSYTEATVVCENFKTRISNRSISAIFPFWPQNLQKDFLLVLSDLKEFHYIAFERDTMKKHEDLRARILFWLLNTAPSFALCQFVYEANNTEFSHCETIKNGTNPSYKRKPFKCLSKALSSKVLGKLKDMKRDRVK